MEMMNKSHVPMTPEMQRKLIVRRADEAVGKANVVLRDMRRKLDLLNQNSDGNENVRKMIEDLKFRIQAIETDRESVLAWKKKELRKLRGEPLDTD